MDAHYPLQSLALAMLVVGLLSVAALAMAHRRLGGEVRPVLWAWLIGASLVLAGDIGFLLGIESASVTALLTVITGLGVAEWIRALRLYRGETRRLLWPYALSLLTGMVLLLGDRLSASALLMQGMFALLYAGAALQALKIFEPPHLIGRGLLAAVLGLLAVVALIELGLLLSGLHATTSTGFSGAPRAWLFVLGSVGPVMGSFALVLACAERLAHRLHTASLNDSLTGVPNRSAYIEAVQRALASARRHHAPLALLKLDLDHFKRVNEAAGHAAGDGVLVEVCQRIQAALRPEDSLARLGGEEFGVLLPGCSLQAAAEVAERIRRRIAADPVQFERERFPVHVSIGAVASLAGEGTPELLMEAADRHLLAAKAQGRNRVVTALPPAGADAAAPVE